MSEPITTVSLIKPELPGQEQRTVSAKTPRVVSEGMDFTPPPANDGKMFVASIFRFNEHGEVMEYFLKPIEGAKLSWDVSGNTDHKKFEKRFMVFASQEKAEGFLSMITGPISKEPQLGHIYEVVPDEKSLWLQFATGFVMNHQYKPFSSIKFYFNHFDNKWEELAREDYQKFLSIG